MHSRVVAALLALVMFWSTLAAQERAFALDAPDAGPTISAAGVSPYAGTDGSVDDHHLDDQPAQAHGEHLPELPGLLQRHPELQMPALAMAPPALSAPDAPSPPYLDAPQRPPCAAAVAA